MSEIEEKLAEWEKTLPDLVETDPDLPLSSDLGIKDDEWEHMDALDIELTMNQQQLDFCEEFLKTHNRKKAEKAGGYAPNTSGRIMSYPKVRAYLRKRLQERALPGDAVLAMVAEIATGSIGDFLTFPDGVTTPIFDLQQAKEDGKLHLIRKIRYIDKGHGSRGAGIEIELYDRQWALDFLGKHLGLLKEPEVKVDNYVIRVVRE